MCSCYVYVVLLSHVMYMIELLIILLLCLCVFGFYFVLFFFFFKQKTAYEMRISDWSSDVCSSDLDRIAPSLEVGFAHFPAFEKAGIRRIVNGPFTFAPDGNPLIGPVRGLRNFWVACGVMAGFSQGGGVGLALANWMVEDDPGFDVWGMDIARYGDWATLAYTNAQVRETYSRRFKIGRASGRERECQYG